MIYAHVLRSSLKMATVFLSVAMLFAVAGCSNDGNPGEGSIAIPKGVRGDSGAATDDAAGENKTAPYKNVKQRAAENPANSPAK